VRRRLLNLLTALSLLLCLAVCVLWVRSYFIEDNIFHGTWERGDNIITTKGRIVVELLSTGHPVLRWRHWTAPPGSSPRTATEAGVAPTWWLPGVEWAADVNRFSLSLAWPAALALVLPCVRALSRRTSTVNHCINCGYDLRATLDRCPECGTHAAYDRDAWKDLL
jgi:hypothetical protein